MRVYRVIALRTACGSTWVAGYEQIEPDDESPPRIVYPRRASMSDLPDEDLIEQINASVIPDLWDDGVELVHEALRRWKELRHLARFKSQRNAVIEAAQVYRCNIRTSDPERNDILTRAVDALAAAERGSA